MRGSKQREKASGDPVVCCIAASHMKKFGWIYGKVALLLVKRGVKQFSTISSEIQQTIAYVDDLLFILT
ncbi:hypothetical protein [Bacillus cereus group sp. BfR-BA-01380]|uniref:hypothetical protein n=1 Tax=Bacillus cereus group sp. BfR-BA-01380 TaxID=2920324 RepID=UPI001F57820A|nr:hypothetical protein [Bacillus cereus group sp. BfR-BA-01380]